MRRLTILAAAVLQIAALAIVVAAPAAAAPAASNNQFSGVADFSRFGAGCDGLYLMPAEEGWSLHGCLVITSITREQWNPSGTYQESGTELFEGWVTYDGEPVGEGTFTTTYEFRAKYGVIGDFDTEIHGRCQHPTTGGTGVFAGVTGRLDFKDVLEGEGAPYFPFRGHLRLPVIDA